MRFPARAAPASSPRSTATSWSRRPDEAGGGRLHRGAARGVRARGRARQAGLRRDHPVYVGRPAARARRLLRPLVEWGEPGREGWSSRCPTWRFNRCSTAATRGASSEYFKVDSSGGLPGRRDRHPGSTRPPSVASPFTPDHPRAARTGRLASHRPGTRWRSTPPNTKWFYFYLAMWMDPSLADARRRDRARAFMDDDEAVVGGQGAARTSSHPTRAWTGCGRRSATEKFARQLQALKDRYDPDNLFALNPNIPPSGASA